MTRVSSARHARRYDAVPYEVPVPDTSLYELLDTAAACTRIAWRSIISVPRRPTRRFATRCARCARLAQAGSTCRGHG